MKGRCANPLDAMLNAVVSCCSKSSVHGSLLMSLFWRISTVSTVFVATLAASPLLAQAWTTGPRPVRYLVPGVVGDGSTPQGGTPPAENFEPKSIGPADIQPTYDPRQWIVVGTGHGDNGIHRVDGGEAKFRITCNASHSGYFDPILARGRTGGSHHHTFIGNKHTDQNSDYTSLRRNPASSCSGGPINGTAYWEPSLMAVTAGKLVVYRPNVASFYYTVQPYSESRKLSRLLNGLAFIGGVDPNDFNDTARRVEYGRAKGLPAGDTLIYPGNGWGGWQCVTRQSETIPASAAHAFTDHWGNAGANARYLRGPDGQDPWDGRCTSGTTIIANIFAPSCWDGHNLTSPDGRSHFRYPARSAQGSVSALCPSGWWQVPHFEVKVEFSHAGFADYGQRFLSSDRMNSAATPPDPKSLDPCRARGPWFCNGATMHFDWMNGWQRDILDAWLRDCVGVSIEDQAGNPLTCGISTIGPTRRLLGGYSGERSPDPRFSNDPILVLDDLLDNPRSEQLLGELPLPSAQSHHQP
jgi:hypothetical protein